MLDRIKSHIQRGRYGEKKMEKLKQKKVVFFAVEHQIASSDRSKVTTEILERQTELVEELCYCCDSVKLYRSQKVNIKHSQLFAKLKQMRRRSNLHMVHLAQNSLGNAANISSWWYPITWEDLRVDLCLYDTCIWLRYVDLALYWPKICAIVIPKLYF